jgi:2-iminobutanoate/2-iminopropanoate deaminase
MRLEVSYHVLHACVVLKEGKSKMKKTLAVLVLLLAASFIGKINSEPQSQRRYINVVQRNLPFSDAVLVSDTLYLAGHLGLDPNTGQAPEDVDKEIRMLLDGFQLTLKQADMTMDHLVSVQVYCTDLSLYDKFNSAYRSYFKREFPARAFLGASALLRGAHFELQGIAVKN